MTTDQVCELIRTIGTKNYAQMKAVVERMIAREEAQGRGATAGSLRYALRSWPMVFTLTELPREIKNMVWPDAPRHSLKSLWLDSETTKTINSLLKERRAVEQLRQAGLAVRNRLLFHGLTGNGKTSLAGAIAKELGLQLFSLKLSNVVSGFMGHTGKNLGDIFDYAISNDCVLLMDELDSLASSRTAESIASNREYNLVVNELIMMLDRVPDSTIIVGATNRLDVIDAAIKRRFNLCIELCQPPKDAAIRYILSYEGKHGINLFSRNDELPDFSSWAAVEAYCGDRHREIIIAEVAPLIKDAVQ